MYTYVYISTYIYIYVRARFSSGLQAAACQVSARSAPESSTQQPSWARLPTAVFEIFVPRFQGLVFDTCLQPSLGQPIACSKLSYLRFQGLDFEKKHHTLHEACAKANGAAWRDEIADKSMMRCDTGVCEQLYAYIYLPLSLSL